jgi:hypothetical protein
VLHKSIASNWPVNGARPAGERRIVNSASGMALANLFTVEQVNHVALGWSAKSMCRVSLELYSKKKALQPGQTVNLDGGYEVR